MAKKSKIAKARKQQEMIARYADLRQELKANKDSLTSITFRCTP